MLKINAQGKIVSSTALNFGKYSADLQSISLRGQRLAIGGNFAQGTSASKGFVTVLTFDEGFRNVIRLESKPYRLTDDEDMIVGVALLDDGRVLVAGNAGIKQVATHSVVAAGKPFLSLLDSSASELAFQWLDVALLEVVATLIEGDKGPYLLGHRNPPLTHGTGERLITSLFSLKLR